MGSTSPVALKLDILDGSGNVQCSSRNFLSAGSNVTATLRNSRRSPLSVVTSTSNALNFTTNGTAVLTFVARYAQFGT